MRGFTLIELSIVIVIIGLILGGLLLGKDLVHASRIRAQISDIERLRTAVNNFKFEYNCLPGDCLNATRYFTGGSQPTKVTNGNGDGKIAGVWDTLHGTWWNIENPLAEWSSVYDHLAAAGLWEIQQYDERLLASAQVGIVYPPLKFYDGGDAPVGYEFVKQQGGMGVGYDTGILYLTSGNKIRLGMCSGTSYPNMGCGINPTSANIIDTKIDDGKPYSGAMVITGFAYNYYMLDNFQNDTGACGNAPATGYNLSDPMQNRYKTKDDAYYSWSICALAIDAKF